MKQLNLRTSAGAVGVGYTFSGDVALKGLLVGNSGGVALSHDPSYDVNALTQDAIDDQLIFQVYSVNAPFFFPLSYPVPAGQSVFFACDSANTFVLSYELQLS